MTPNYNNFASNALRNLEGQASAQSQTQNQGGQTGSGEAGPEGSALPTSGQKESLGEGSGEGYFPRVPTAPVPWIIQQQMNEIYNAPAPALVAQIANGTQIYNNNGNYQDYNGNPYLWSDTQKTYVPGAAVEEPNIPVAINNVPNVSLPSYVLGIPVTPAAEKPTATPDGFPIKEWNGNVVTDEVGKTWLWDGQNLNQQPENIDSSGGIKIAADGSTPLTQVNGTWYNLQTNTLYDEQGYPKVAEQPVIINPITITPSMAYGGAGTWDEVVAWSGGTAGASYVVVAGKVYTRQQWESGLVPGQQGPVISTVTPETPFINVITDATPVEYAPAVYDAWGKRTDNLQTDGSTSRSPGISIGTSVTPKSADSTSGTRVDVVNQAGLGNFVPKGLENITATPGGSPIVEWKDGYAIAANGETWRADRLAEAYGMDYESVVRPLFIAIDNAKQLVKGIPDSSSYNVFRINQDDDGKAPTGDYAMSSSIFLDGRMTFISGTDDGGYLVRRGENDPNPKYYTAEEWYKTVVGQIGRRGKPERDIFTRDMVFGKVLEGYDLNLKNGTIMQVNRRPTGRLKLDFGEAGASPNFELSRLFKFTYK